MIVWPVIWREVESRLNLQRASSSMIPIAKNSDDGDEQKETDDDDGDLPSCKRVRLRLHRLGRQIVRVYLARSVVELGVFLHITKHHI